MGDNSAVRTRFTDELLAPTAHLTQMCQLPQERHGTAHRRPCRGRLASRAAERVDEYHPEPVAPAPALDLLADMGRPAARATARADTAVAERIRFRANRPIVIFLPILGIPNGFGVCTVLRFHSGRRGRFVVSGR